MTFRTKVKRAAAKVFVPPSKRGAYMRKVRREEQVSEAERQAYQEGEMEAARARGKSRAKERANEQVFRLSEQEAYARGREEGARQRGLREAREGRGGGVGALSRIGSAFVGASKHLPDASQIERDFYGGSGSRTVKTVRGKGKNRVITYRTEGGNDSLGLDFGLGPSGTSKDITEKDLGL